jgi:hypothetical protein
MIKAKKGAKMRKIERMLRRKKGCTSAEVKAALGWKSVSIPQRARQLGIRLYVLNHRYWAV